MSEEITKELAPVLAAIQAMRSEFNQRFEALEVRFDQRFEALEKRTTPLNETLGQMRIDIGEIKADISQLKSEIALIALDVAKMTQDMSRLKELTWSNMGDHEKRIRDLEEATRKSS